MYGSAGKPERNLSEKGEAISDFHTPRSAKVSRGWCGFLFAAEGKIYAGQACMCRCDLLLAWMPNPCLPRQTASSL